MMIKGCLLPCNAIVKHFQTKNSEVHPSCRPLPIRISQPYVVLENCHGGATRLRKCLMISLSISIQYRCMTDIQTLADSN